MALSIFIIYLIFTLISLSRQIDSKVWDIVSVVYLVVATLFGLFSPIFGMAIWCIVAVVIVIHRVEELRQVISQFIYKRSKSSLPKMSKTEAAALDAGDTWFEESIFRGEPDLDKLQEISPNLTHQEQNFLDKEVNELCSMLDEWSIEQAGDLPEQAWQYIRDHGFLGLVIPTEFGGRGFSAHAHSEVVMKIASRCCAAAVSVMVPNSLGPAELLLHYGDKQQKAHYLPRLASGEEIPCFALTEPEAGSDATSIGSHAIVVNKKIDGKEVLGLEISLDKRWITLAPVATLLGVAVDLRDPDNLLSGVGAEGITCVLIPRNTKNLEIGNRHLPAHIALMNGTIRGEGIFVPINNIIGGQKMAGLGWEMLVECLSIGRSISLPALSTAASGVAYLTTGAYACIRQQFRVEIGQFEGVQEKLAEIAGLNYLINATRILTLSAVDAGKKPSVASAITKYFSTEFARTTINSAMDIHGGRAVVLGPRNYLANLYTSMPIFITVEGANIMTRNLLIFGQGSIAAHPFLKLEIQAIQNEDEQQFHTLLWEHIHYFMRNFAKSIISSWSGGMFIKAPSGSLNKEYKRLISLSHNYAWLADLVLIYLGGSLKFKERVSARLADAMAYLYMASASLQYASEKEENPDNILHAKWAANYCFSHAKKAMLDLCANLPSGILGRVVGFLISPRGQTLHATNDKLDNKLASMMMKNNTYRNHLAESVYLSGDNSQPIDRVEYAHKLIQEHKELYEKFSKLKKYKLTDVESDLEKAVADGKLSKEEFQTIMKIERARRDAILVDEFSLSSVKSKKFSAYEHLI